MMRGRSPATAPCTARRARFCSSQRNKKIEILESAAPLSFKDQHRSRETLPPRKSWCQARITSFQIFRKLELGDLSRPQPAPTPWTAGQHLDLYFASRSEVTESLGASLGGLL